MKSPPENLMGQSVTAIDTPALVIELGAGSEQIPGVVKMRFHVAGQ